MNELAGQLYIPIVLFICISVCVVLVANSFARTKLAQQETIRSAIQAGQKLDEETLKLLAKTPKSPDADLRQGVITVCLAVGFVFAAILSQFMQRYGDLATVIGMIAIIVGSIGIGQLIAWKVREVPTQQPTPIDHSKD
jgi:hypothetical protein